MDSNAGGIAFKVEPRGTGRCCFLLANGFDFVCREIDRVCAARNLPPLKNADLPELLTEWDGECRTPALDIQRD